MRCEIGTKVYLITTICMRSRTLKFAEGEELNNFLILSKKISNDQELIQIPHPALKTKREITKYINWQQFTKGTRGKPNE